MPSPNPRIQVAATPDLYAQVKTLAKGRNVTLSNMVQELCLHALKTEEIRAEYQHACDTYGEVPVQEDKRVRPEARPWVKNYTETDRNNSQPQLVPDGKGGLVDPSLTEDQLLAIDLNVAQQARPVFTREEQEKIFSMMRAGVITKEQALEMMSSQPVEEGQSKEEKQMQMRGDLLKTIGEQDERLKRIEEMMAKLEAKI